MQVFNPDGSYLQTIGNGEGAANGQFSNPMHIDIDDTGKVYVADQNNKRVQVFNPDGSYNWTLTTSPAFSSPRGIVVDNTGKIYVADTSSQKVKIFTSEGILRTSISINDPTGVTVDEDGRIYVADTANHRVLILNSKGFYLTTLGGNGAGNANNQFNLPQGVAVDSSGRIYVADTYNSRIQVFNSDYSYLATITGFWEVYDVEVDSTGKIYAVDYYNNRVRVLHGYPSSTQAGVTVSKSTSTITEDDGGDSYDVVLTSEPAADVTVTVQPAPADVLSFSTTSLTFTSGNWNIPQTVSFSKPEDSIASGAQVVTLSHTTSSTDAAYNNFSVSSISVTVNDNDTAGIFVTKSSSTITEGDSGDSYNVILMSQPTADVIVTLQPDLNGVLTLSATTLTFTNADWNIPQTVTFSKPEDSIASGTQLVTLSHSVASNDPTYDSLAVAGVSVTVNDNDSAGVVVSKLSSTITEGDSGDGYEVVLFSQPSADVVISVQSAPADVLNLSATTLTFTSADWSTPQTMTFSKLEDSIAGGTQVVILSHNVASADSTYNNLAVSGVSVTVNDNDNAGVVVSKSTSTITEGDLGDSYEVVLTSQPSAEVVVTVQPSPADIITLSATTLTFTGADWNIPQTITFSRTEDNVVSDTQLVTLSHTTSSADSAYHNLVVSGISVTVYDNDTIPAGVMVSKSTSTITEGDAGDSYDIVLTSQPSADVVVTVQPDVEGILSLSVTTLTFTGADWDIPQTVTFSKPEDNIASGTQLVALSHSVSSADGAYSNLAVSGVSVNVNDNDSAGIVVSKSTSTIAEGDLGDSYEVVLTSQPTADVSVTVQTTPADVLVLSATALTFTSADWNTPQTVTFSKQEDNVVSGALFVTLSHTASSADGAYNSLAVNGVSVTINDNDTNPVGALVSKTSSTISEGDEGDSYTLVLASQPTADVLVFVQPAPANVLSLPLTTLTFTNGNWNIPQNVTFSKLEDTVASGTQTVTLSHTVVSADSAYNFITVGSVTVTVHDNDEPVIELLRNPGFETRGQESPRDALHWTPMRLLTGDRRICNVISDKGNKIYSHSGKCAFRFSATTPSPNARKIRQKNIPVDTLVMGDQLVLSAWVRASHLTRGGIIQVIITYPDNHVERLNLTIPVGKYRYRQISNEITLTGPPIGITAVIGVETMATGTLLIDDLSLTSIPDIPEEAWVPLANEPQP